MAFDDRDYSRQNYGGTPGSGLEMFYRVIAWLNQSFRMFTLWRVVVRIHILFLLFIAVRVLFDLANVVWTLRWMALLFVSVLLHEFGHVLACRRVGGRADEIIMWPLGGLAMCDPPRRPWPDFWTTFWGPMVTFLLAAGAWTTLALTLGPAATGVTFNPFNPWVVEHMHGGFVGVVQDLFVVNYILLLFNLALIFYPFDGGRLVQAVIWMRSSYRRSMELVIPVGLVGSILVGVIGLVVNQALLVLIAVFGGITCYQQAMRLRYASEYGEGSGGEGWLQFRESYLTPDDDDDEPGAKPKRMGWIQRRRERKQAERQRRDAERAEHDAAELDRILAKVSHEGLESLTPAERRTLENATKKKRGER